jgi:predicted MFS family arabinose efflux permease
MAAPVSPGSPASPVSERMIVFLIGAIQFVNILDFMMVMPLGPDFASGLGISVDKLGYIGGSYTAAAAVTGVIGSLFLDRYDRRRALAVAMFGLFLGTLAGGFATSFTTLLAARVLAGAFGGPATSLSAAIIVDVIPPERRGKALGAVAGAFSVASVLGVPAGLFLARFGGWRAPFFAVAGVSLIVTTSALFVLPPMHGHLARHGTEPNASILDIVRRPTVLLSQAMGAIIMLSGFLIVPNISTYVQHNLGYPRASLEQLYVVGGTLSFIANRYIGRLVDRHGCFRVGSIGTALFVAVIYVGFADYRPEFPVVALFVAFMLASSFRLVPYNTLASKVPAAHERARFMSLQSAVQHLASAVGAFFSARLLRALPDGRLDGLVPVAYLSIALAMALPLFLWLVESRVRGGAAALAATSPVKESPVA